MTLITVRPNGSSLISSAGAGATLTGGASYDAVTADSSDLSYVDQAGSLSDNSLINYSFGTFSIPAGAQVRSVTPRYRQNATVGTNGALSTTYLQLVDDLGNFASEALPATVGIATNSGVTRTTKSRGAAWDQAGVDALGLNVRNGGVNAGDIKTYELYLDVVYNSAPSATGTGPNANASTTRPAFTWSYSDADGDAQERYWIRVYTATQAAATGFDPRPGGTTPVAESGETFSSLTSWICTTDLVNGVSYRAYIFVADAGSGGRYNYAAGGPYPYATATILIPLPAVPEITVTSDTAGMGDVLTIQDRQSLIPADDFSLEGSLGTWVLDNNCSVARTSFGSAEQGGFVLDITANGGGVATAKTGFIAGIQAGVTYSARAAFWRVTTTRTCRVDIQWFTSGGSLLSTSTGIAVSEATSSWQPSFCTGVAPATATQAKILVAVLGTPANGEHHYVDTVALVPGALNQFPNPIFEIDADADGIGDSWQGTASGSGTITYALDTAKVFAGVASQRMTVAGNTGRKGIFQQLPLGGSQAYTLSVWVQTDRTMNVILNDQFPMTSGGTSTAVTAGTWTRLTYTWTPASTNLWDLSIQTDSSAGVIWVGHAQVELGSTASDAVFNRYPWVAGALTASASASHPQVQRSSDGGVTWTTVPRFFQGTTPLGDLSGTALGATATQLLSNVEDYEVPRGLSTLYRVRSVATLNGATLVSQWSAWISATALPVSGVWVKDPIDMTRNRLVVLEGSSIDRSRTESQGIHYGLGRSDPIVVHGTVRRATFPLTLFFPDDASWQAWKVLQDSQRTLLLQTCYGNVGADECYFTIDPDVQTSELTVPAMSSAQPRRVVLTARETVSP